MDWAEYREAALGKPVNPFYSVLEPHLEAAGTALELGAGSGKGAVWLADRGWHVIAVEPDPLMLEDLRGLESPGIEVVAADFASFDYEGADLSVFCFSLFFQEPEDFPSSWHKLTTRWTRPGGMIAGQLLGPGDAWNGRPGMTFHTAEQVDALLDRMTVLHREEHERDGFIVTGEPKRWHVHHLVARLPEG